jgi:hypothetical protein
MSMAPQATPITTVDDIDEALWWVLLTAPRRRLDYMKIVDALLDQRNAISPTPPPTPDDNGEQQSDHHRVGRGQ